MSGEEITETEDYLTMATYLTQIYDTFRCEIPHIKHPKIDLPDKKKGDSAFRSLKPLFPSHFTPKSQVTVHHPAPIRPSSKHKRHIDAASCTKQPTPDRKTRKRRTLDKMGATVDHENKPPNQTRGNTDEDFAARIKNLEDKWKDPQPVEKKPKDLLRAIGKIETSDWNIKEIEKKIRENKMGKTVNKDKEKVPKWSREQFVARQTKMEKQHLDRQDSAEAKFADIDKNIKHLELKLKEGTNRDLGQSKVASITEKLVSKVPESSELKPLQKSQSRPAVLLPPPNQSEFCHFCGKRVYLMERLSAEGRFFHHSCFKCQYCNAQLRLGSYAYDKDGLYDHKFFCLHHYGMQAEPKSKIARKASQRKSPEKKHLGGIAGVDLLDRVRTPERVEFANLSVANPSDHEESLSQMDEDEWTDKNFGASTAELGSSDDESSSTSYTDSDDDAYEEALEEPATKEGTLKWAERFKKRYSKKRNDSESDDYSSSDSSYYENTSDDDDSDTATEGEEEIRARELRKQEVRVEPPVVQPDTGTDTEVVSEEESSSSEIQNSATEISTDSEFAHDDPTPTREIPSIVFNDVHVTKTRGTGGRGLGAPRKIQVTSGYIHRPSEKKKAPSTTPKQDIELKLSPLVPSAPMLRKPLSLLPRTEGYALNRTQSTGGIAAKVSLELKKRYLLGENNGPGSIQKSGSASTLDTKLRSFHSNISDCQKLLKPATEVSASMQTFCNKLDERLSPVVQPAQIFPETKTEVFENESEGRPRSPVHETSIIVPEIDWTKNIQTDDSLSTDSVSDGESHRKIPTIQIQIDENPPDSLIDIPKSVSEKKTLNQPKLLPDLEMKDILPEIHESLHVRQKSESSDSESIAEPVTSALTETELSDWARDGEVSDDLDDEFGESKDKNKTNVEEMKKTIITEALNSVLSKNLDNIEFMDTGTETSSEDGVADSQEGYTLLKTDEELAEDSLNPNINEIIEAKNDAVKNTGYCVIENFGSKVVDLKPSDLEKLKDKNSGDHDEDSLIIVETGTTTEDNTCSDSTVKNITEMKPLENNNFQRRRLEEKLAKLKAEMSSQKNVENSVEFDQHCQRLQSKIEFGNAKDSIDIRKSRRKSKDSPQKPDLIQEESSSPAQSPKVTLKLTPCIRTPDVLYNKELLEKERDVNQKLVQEMVMNKMKAENKSLERKKRRSRPFELSKCATTDVVSEINFNKEFETPSKRDSTYSSGSSVYATPDVLLSTLKFEDTFQTPMTSIKPEISDISSQPGARKALFNEDFKTPVAPPRLKAAEKLREDARLRAKMLSNEDLGLSPEDKFAKLKGKLVKKQDVADEDAIFRRCESFLYSNDTLNRKKSGSLKRSKSRDEDKPPLRTKSIGEIVDSPKPLEKICKSDPNLLDTDPKKNKKKGKDRERRKSITRMIATFFTKKSPMNSKGIFSRMSPKTKDVSKSCANLDLKDTDVVVEEPVRRKSFSETSTRRFENSSPPPIPPLPLNYSGNSIKGTDESSDGEHDWKRHDRSSCDTLDQSGVQDNSVSSVSGRKSKGAVKVARQAQRKRHRMAQEIQRKLEETEVKTRELEERGVVVEKALRGEDSNRYSRDESELLQEWFDLMRDRTELRRYERELMVRGQELELEDRHARLQHDLRERLDNNQQKTSEEVEIEGSIIKEMMEIVAKRDGLIALLEEDRLRYSNEDRDFEEQMLAKGLQLTPIRKPPEK